MGPWNVSRIDRLDRVRSGVYLHIVRSLGDQPDLSRGSKPKGFTMNAFFKDRAALLATIILVGQAVVYYTNPAKEVIPAMAPWSEFPSTVTDWKAVSDTPLDREVLDVLQPDDYLIRDYISSDRSKVASLFVGYFSSRRNGHNPHSPEWCLPGAGWKSLSTRVISIPIPSGNRPLPANEYLIEKGMNKDLVLYWYHQGGRTVSSDLAAQIYALP